MQADNLIFEPITPVITHIPYGKRYHRRLSKNDTVTNIKIHLQLLLRLEQILLQ